MTSSKADLHSPPWIWPRAAYIHIPFCAFHCGYCDFAVAVGNDQRIEDYLSALEAELRTLGQPQKVDTLFLGGGTPTYLSVPQLQRLFNILLPWFPLNPDGEFSVEANPGTLTEDKIKLLAEHGVNRVSLGAQSFHLPLLQVLERDHLPRDVPVAMEQVKKRIPRVSLDMIFGVPGQTLKDWEEDLKRAIQLQPDHFSTYGLTYEKGTRLWKQQRQGEVQSLGEDLELAMYELAMDYLDAQGYEHYEISNFAKPGNRCRHNQVYWANHAYFGLGMGAARYVEGVRDLNTRDLDTYIRRALAGKPTQFQSEKLAPLERALETIGVNWRKKEGIDRDAFFQQTGFQLNELVGDKLKHHCELGLIHDSGKNVALTRRGKCVADSIIQEYWN